MNFAALFPLPFPTISTFGATPEAVVEMLRQRNASLGFLIER